MFIFCSLNELNDYSFCRRSIARRMCGGGFYNKVKKKTEMIFMLYELVTVFPSHTVRVVVVQRTHVYKINAEVPARARAIIGIPCV